MKESLKDASAANLEANLEAKLEARPDLRPDARLADGAAPATPAELFARLEALAIAAESFEHPAVHTVEEAKALRGELAGAHIKKLIWPPDFVSESVSGIHHFFSTLEGL